jgi:hypothetical protein
MAHDLMLNCEAKKLFMRDGVKVREWTIVPVSTLVSGASYDIRCMHCHGAVKVHKRQVEHGPADHVEHRSRQDSERCKAGVHFQGDHRLSLNPVI